LFKLLIFDLDGTLIDSALDITNAVNQMLALYHKPAQPLATVITHIGEGLKNLMKDFFPNLDAAATEQLYSQFLDIYGKNLLNHTQPYPGVVEFLESWPRKVAIVTNKPIRYTEEVLRGLGLDRFLWTQVFGADSLPRRKPDPMPILEVMKIANCLPHETVMIGDGTPDIRAAVSAGVTAIAIEFGYTHPDKLMKLGARARLSSFQQLMPLLEQIHRELYNPSIAT
jgi:phosphoglycolate phosphatase